MKLSFYSLGYQKENKAKNSNNDQMSYNALCRESEIENQFIRGVVNPIGLCSYSPGDFQMYNSEKGEDDIKDEYTLAEQ